MYNHATDATNDNFGQISFGDYNTDNQNCIIAAQRDSGGVDSGKLVFLPNHQGAV